MKKAGKKGVILLSGGLDSATTLYLARKRGYSLSALIFDYQQRHKKEIKYALKIAKLNKIKCYIEKIDLSWVKSSLAGSKLKVPYARRLNSKKVPLTYVSGRNIIFLSYAFSLAESINADTVFIGAHVQDYSGYPDCRPQFLKSFEKAANLGIKDKKIKIETPLINKAKKDIVKLGLKLGVPFQYTWSCYSGKDKPCGKCDSCRFRVKAFKELGIYES